MVVREPLWACVLELEKNPKKVSAERWEYEGGVEVRQMPECTTELAVPGDGGR